MRTLGIDLETYSGEDIRCTGMYSPRTLRSSCSPTAMMTPLCGSWILSRGNPFPVRWFWI